MFNRGVPVFDVFDVLWLDGEDLRDLPRWERKEILRGVIRQPRERTLFVDHIEEDSKALFDQICERDLEGIVAKPMISLYREVKGQTT
jgi:bifunctional non-homologous end joining protein LigD